MSLKMSIAELDALLADVFPQIGGRFQIIALEPFRATVAMTTDTSELRPGGTVSGPAMFGLADCAFYILSMAMIGPEPLTVTTNCSIDFLRKPKPGRLVAEARILKLGRSLSVGDVLITCEGVEGPVARASLTYAIPPRRH
ncbi:hotdog fold thioesterase [bacterium]|nr:hotdog fold thioesterase [bacterium]